MVNNIVESMVQVWMFDQSSYCHTTLIRWLRRSFQDGLSAPLASDESPAMFPSAQAPCSCTSLMGLCRT